MAEKTLSEELAEVQEQMKQLKAKRDDIYRRSLEAPEEEKVCSDAVSEMVLNKNEKQNTMFPLEVAAVNWVDGEMELRREGVPRLVAIRPCDSEEAYLGIYVGELPLGCTMSYHRESKILSIHHTISNPAIIVPALKKVVMGIESWWAFIETEEQLRQITDEDIENTWYVRAIRKMVEGDE